jgi:outer membrane biosynthesis protein TonB
MNWRQEYWLRAARAIRLGKEAMSWDWWSDTLIQATAMSLAIHVLLFGFAEIGHQLGWWKVAPMRSLLKGMPRLNQVSQANARQQQKQNPQEPPLLFIDVSPAQATPDSPKDAKYYSSVNSRAANPNPDPKSQSNTPRIDGTQTKIAKTITTPRPETVTPKPAAAPPSPPRPEPKPENPSAAQPLQPAPKPTPAPEPKPVEIAKAVAPAPSNVKAGNTQMGESPVKPAGGASSPPAASRPRTVAEAKQRMAMLAGEKMKQEGGVKRFAVESSLDVKATPFGQYDAKFIAAVQQRWFDILEERDYVHGRSGKVVLRFNLYYDGRITNMEVADSTVGELLALVCQRAVMDPAPYDVWPSDLRRLAKSNYREVQFTFFYN